MMTGLDCIVAGAGPAGLAAAALVAQGGKQVALIAGPPSGADPRTVALMQPSINLLATLGLCPGELEEQASPLRRLRLVDDTGSRFVAPEMTFSAGEIGEDAFGWNIPLTLLVASLRRRAVELGVNLIDDSVTGARSDGGTISVELAAASKLAGRVALAADGRHSILRRAAGISIREWSYDQTAIAASFAHSSGHRDTSWEFHRPGGPFTTVPMRNGRSSLVWMERPPRAAELMALDTQHFAAEIQIASHGELGLIAEPGPRRAFEMKGLAARAFARNRVMLAGEAAHVVPPIGAQGLNMSLRDAAQAAELILGRDDPGAAETLDDYDRLRRRDVAPRQQIIDLMNRSLLSDFLPLGGARAGALAVLDQFGPLRRFIMRRGLGPGGDALPRAMRG